ncbi:MAG: DUF4240 domain-containing protein [Bacteroidota bacterium]
MTEPEFWKLIELSKEFSPLDIDRQSELLVDLLQNRSLGDVKDFDKILTNNASRLDLPDIYLAAYVIFDKKPTHLDYKNLQTWLIANGEKSFNQTLKQPTSIDTWIMFKDKEFIHGDPLGSVPHNAYYKKTKLSDDLFYSENPGPKNNFYTEEPGDLDLQCINRFPKLIKTFW